MYGWVPMYPSCWRSWTLPMARDTWLRGRTGLAHHSDCEIWSERWQGAFLLFRLIDQDLNR